MWIKGDYMILNSYEINVDTLLIIPIDKNTSKVIEFDYEYVVNMSCLEIIKYSCLYFGSSYEGRRDATQNMTGIVMKVPIIIEESRNIIFFPVSNCIHNNSIWISYHNLVNFYKIDKDSTKLIFLKNRDFMVDVKYNLIDNQFVRCIKLSGILDKRKKFLDDNNLIFDNCC